MKFVNWDTVYDLLEEILTPVDITESFLNEMEAVFVLRNIRTVYLGSGRQNGKTEWALRTMLNDPGTIFIARDVTHRKMAIQAADLLSQSINEGRFENKAVSITIPPYVSDPAEIIESAFNEVKCKHRWHIYTATDVEKILKNKPETFPSVKRVIIDDALHNHKTSKVYDMIAWRVPAEDLPSLVFVQIV